jgi:hypothetical protein
MRTQVAAGKTDDPGFIAVLNSLVNGLISNRAPEELWIIQIDNWFDHKWLGFSGMGAVASNIPIDRYDTVKAESYQEKLTFPPFAPNRVLDQFSYVRVGNDYTESPLPTLPHGTARKPSETNLRRRVEKFSRSACFVWYSANTLANGRGSVMVYNVASDRPDGWFAAFSREQGWKLHATKGVSQDDIEQLIERR